MGPPFHVRASAASCAKIKAHAVSLLTAPKLRIPSLWQLPKSEKLLLVFGLPLLCSAMCVLWEALYWTVWGRHLAYEERLAVSELYNSVIIGSSLVIAITMGFWTTIGGSLSG